MIEKDGQKARSTSVIELLLLCGQPGADITASSPQARTRSGGRGDWRADRGSVRGGELIMARIRSRVAWHRGVARASEWAEPW